MTSPQLPIALVTGASGFVARTLIPALQRHGYRVRAALRQPRPGPWDESITIGDLNEPVDWHRATLGVDAVWHLAARVHVMRDTAADPLAAFRAVNVERTAELCRAAEQAGVRRLVYVSSIKVNGEATLPGQAFRSTDVPAPADAYGVSKHEAEQVVRRARIESVIVRPPLIYGPGVGANFARLMDAVARGKWLPLGGIRNRRDLVYAGNLADALVRMGNHVDAAGKTFLIRDGESLCTPDLVRAIATAMNVRPKLLAIPESVLLAGLSLLGKRAEALRLLGSLEVDASELDTALGWRPPYSMQEGLIATVAAR